MTTRQIVDEHFTSNYKYYRQVCYQYYRGRYLYEDLLNEAYLKFISIKPETIDKFLELNKLHCIGLKIIRSLYQKRTNGLKYSNAGGSSPLFETKGVEWSYNFIDDNQTKDEKEIQLYFEKAVKTINEALTYPVTESKKRTPYQLVQTFLAVQESSIGRISIETGISRPHIKETYKQAKEYLKNEITK